MKEVGIIQASTESERDLPMTIMSVIETSRTNQTYNFTVADFHTYFVGKQRVLVHNCNRTANDTLRRDTNGRPQPDPEAAGSPHSQLGTRKDSSTGEPREFDADGKPVRDVDFTDHNRPQNHDNPHQHKFEQVSGSYKRMPAEPLDE